MKLLRPNAPAPWNPVMLCQKMTAGLPVEMITTLGILATENTTGLPNMANMQILFPPKQNMGPQGTIIHTIHHPHGRRQDLMTLATRYRRLLGLPSETMQLPTIAT